jgi:hypothetical protein
MHLSHGLYELRARPPSSVVASVACHCQIYLGTKARKFWNR